MTQDPIKTQDQRAIFEELKTQDLKKTQDSGPYQENPGPQEDQEYSLEEPCPRTLGESRYLGPRILCSLRSQDSVKFLKNCSFCWLGTCFWITLIIVLKLVFVFVVVVFTPWPCRKFQVPARSFLGKTKFYFIQRIRWSQLKHFVFCISK